MNHNWLYDLLRSWRVEPELANHLSLIATFFLVFLAALALTLLFRRLLLRYCLNWIRNNRYRWDDALLKHGVFRRLSWFVPVLLLQLCAESLLPSGTTTYLIIKRGLQVWFVLVSVISISALLSAGSDIYRVLWGKRPELIQGFVDGGKIVAYLLGAIFIVSILSGTSPWGIISVLGGLTAVTMLVFKDTILGFAASIQLSSTDMIRVGDWVEMPSYGADGDVVSISIHTVRIQNWDKTITTIPTYALVSNAFKNWRGMTESGGRRIKRSLMIDLTTIRFCDQPMLDRFGDIQLLRQYLAAKDQEIELYNRTAADLVGSPINARRQTNIGVFRAYVIAYLKNNPLIRQDMTFLVRQLAPTEHGLPLEIYVFSGEQRWAPYEALQADIFDHLLAALPEFGLRAFQNPSGSDLQQLGDRLEQPRTPR